MFTLDINNPAQGVYFWRVLDGMENVISEGQCNSEGQALKEGEEELERQEEDFFQQWGM